MSETKLKEAFDRIFEEDLNTDQRLDRAVEFLNQCDPSLLETAAGFTDEELEAAFLDFVEPATPTFGWIRPRFFRALVSIGALKVRANQAGMPVWEYARLMDIWQDWDSDRI